MIKVFVLIAIIAQILTVAHAQDGQNIVTIDFNKGNLAADFDNRVLYYPFYIQSYKVSSSPPFRSSSQKYLMPTYYNAWMCATTKATYKLEKNAKITLAINLTSSSPTPSTDPSKVQITIIDVDSGLEQLIIEAGITNGWTEVYNISEKAIQNAKVSFANIR